MIARCEHPQNKAYHNYGGRDIPITVCPRWHDPAAFIEDIERLIGPRPEGMSLDRKRNGLGYKPSNVRWADDLTQARNSRRTKLTDSDRQEIHDLYATGKWTQAHLADKYG